jgi:hypothetical protein
VIDAISLHGDAAHCLVLEGHQRAQGRVDVVEVDDQLAEMVLQVLDPAHPVVRSAGHGKAA